MTCTVLLADDHTLVRAGLRALLAGLPEVGTVLEASDGREALEAIATHRPDVVLMDIAMPGLNGLEAAALVTRDHPGTRTIVLSMHGTDAYVLQALRAGAAGYLLKDAAVADCRWRSAPCCGVRSTSAAPCHGWSSAASWPGWRAPIPGAARSTR
jgi:DNA-binding NarL/FixJ family response regulator